MNNKNIVNIVLIQKKAIMDYLIQTKVLDNTIHEITYEQLKQLYKDNLREAEESK